MKVIENYESFDFADFWQKIQTRDIERVLNEDFLDGQGFLTLLSPKASNYLEEMAGKAQALTERNFGRVIYLYAPLYLSNFCDNECAYCGFKRTNQIKRTKLTLAEVEEEAKIIDATGLRHLLILTGESSKESPLSYIKDCVLLLKRFFTSIAIEIYPLEGPQYRELIATGVDGLTIYQETYDKKLYRELHGKGPKSSYDYRLEAPERACREKIRWINIGALLGLADFRRETFLTGLHAAYLQNKYPETEINLSLPRIQPQVSNFVPAYPVSDRDFVQLMLALRIFLPRAGINISTREKSDFRNNLIGLGVTRMSAGSRTEVGGYSLAHKSVRQFDVADKRSVEEIKTMIYARGYQPVLKDWQSI